MLRITLIGNLDSYLFRNTQISHLLGSTQTLNFHFLSSDLIQLSNEHAIRLILSNHDTVSNS